MWWVGLMQIPVKARITFPRPTAPELINPRLAVKQADLFGPSFLTDISTSYIIFSSPLCFALHQLKQMSMSLAKGPLRMWPRRVGKPVMRRHGAGHEQSCKKLSLNWSGGRFGWGLIGARAIASFSVPCPWEVGLFCHLPVGLHAVLQLSND